MSIQIFNIALLKENHEFKGTGGVSGANFHAEFVPAFKDLSTGAVEISRFKDGRKAPFHLFDGLPKEWILKRDVEGRVMAVKKTIVSGFVRFNKFFTRKEASDFISYH